MKKRLKIALLALSSIVFLFCMVGIDSLAKSKVENIILINSYNKGFTWTDDQVEGIVESILEKHPNVNIYVEYLDWKNFPSDRVLENQYQLYLQKYEEIEIDLIITTDDAAMQFAIENRESIFENAPIIFGSVHKLAANRLMADVTNITGVYEKIDTEGTAELIQTVHPNAKIVYAITENTESGKSTADRIHEGFQTLNNPNIQIVSLMNMNYEEIKNILSNPEEDSVVVMASYSTDADGKIFSPLESAIDFGSVSQIPIYLLHDNSMNDEVMGGSMLSGKLHGEQVGYLANEFIRNGDVNSILIDEGVNPNRVINYNSLIKYDILENVIPDDYIIINKPFSFVETYKTYIIIVSIAFILLIILIGILLVNLRIKKKIQSELSKKHLELEKTYETVNLSKEELKAQNEVLIIQKEQRRRAEEKYRLVAESANDSIWSWNIKLNKRELDKKTYELLGYEVGSLDSFDKWIDIIHPNDVKRVKELVNDYLQGKTEKYSCQYRIRKNNGEYIHIKSTGIGTRDHTGDFVEMFGTHTDITQMIEDQKKISDLAYNDYLTGLPNRLSVKEYVDQSIKNQTNKELYIVVYFVDLDNFKFVNNSFGHKTGDLLLNEVAKRLILFKTENTFVGRIGGDEFVIVAEQKPEQIRVFSKRVIELFKLPFIVNERSVYSTASVGYSVYPEDGSNYDELLIKADMAMYKMKESGKSQITRFTDLLGNEMNKKIEYQNLLHGAIERGELSVEYQPQYNFLENRIEGFEALVRWNNPKLGFVPPNEFIAVAESGGLIISIGLFVMREAFLFAKKINDNASSNIVVCVNLSVIQLFQTDFVDHVLETLHETNVKPECIEFEVTESIYAENFEIFRTQLIRLKELGINISLDDFGTGYSSLTYLKRVPISTLKIDKKFTDDILGDTDEHILVETIIELGHKLNMRIIAEGVEEREQLKFLEAHKCPIIQGFIYSKSLVEEDAIKMLNQVPHL